MTPTLPVLLSQGATAPLCAWLLTYAVHSSVALGAVWLFSQMLSQRAHAFREGLWKSGLLIGLVTATLQVGLGTAPGGGIGVLERERRFDRLEADVEVALPQVTEGPRGEVCVFEVKPEAMPFPEREAHDRRRAVSSGTRPLDDARDRRPNERFHVPLVPPTPPEDASPSVPAWAAWVVGAWLFVALVLTCRHLLAWRALHLLLRTRRPLRTGPLPVILEELAHDAGLRRTPLLTTSAHLPGPIAVSRREICIPERAIDELGPQEQEGMLAHELAHIVRRDHDWLRLGLFLENLLFFQPLHRVARRRLQESSEYLCDAWAVRRTGGDVALARCLAEVAGWVAASPRHAVPGMAPRGSALVRRVQSLLAPDSGSLRRLPRAAAIPMILGVVVFGTWAVPGIAPASAPKEPCRAVEIADGGRVLVLPGSGTAVIAGHGRLQLQEGGRVLALPRGCVLAIDGSKVSAATRSVSAGATIRVLDAQRREAWRVRLLGPGEEDQMARIRSRLARYGFVFEVRDGALSRVAWRDATVPDVQVLQLGEATWFLDDSGRPLVDAHDLGRSSRLRRAATPIVEVGLLASPPGGEERWRSKSRGNSKGLHVARVAAGGPAERAGLEAYDLIYKACGTRICDGDDLENVLRCKRPGDRLVLHVKRRDRTLQLSLRVRALDTARVIRHAAARVCVETWRAMHRRERDAREAGDHLGRKKARQDRSDMTRHVQDRLGLKLWEALLARPQLRVF